MNAPLRPQYFLLRLGGLPFDAVDALRCVEASALARRIEAQTRRLAERSAGLCDRLHVLVRSQTDRPTRRDLIQLKRCVHNRRPARARVLLASAGEALAGAPDLAAELEAWATEAQLHEELHASGPSCLAEELDAARAELRAAWSAEAFQTGLLIANRRVYEGLVRYLAQAAPGDRQARQIEQTALAYYSRMATKTSPFSTFTYSAAGHFEDAPCAPLIPAFRSSYTLELGLVEGLFRDAIARVDGDRRLPLALNETLCREDAEWLFLTRRRRPDGRRVPDESFRSVRDGPAVQAATNLLPPGDAPLSASGVVAGLRERLGANLAEEKLQAFVAQLRECGLLRVAVSYDSNGPDALTHLARALAPYLGPIEHEFLAAVRRVCGGMGALAASTVAERAAIGRQVAAETQRLGGLLRDGAECHWTASPVRQDCYLDADVALPARDFDGVFASLGALNRLMPLFDAASLLRQQVRAHYLGRHDGPSAPQPLTTFLRDFYAEYYERWLATTDSIVWDPFLTHVQEEVPPEAREMARLRGSWTDAVREAITASGSRDVALPAALVESFGDQAAHFWSERLPPSTGYFGQPVRYADGRRPLGFVLNQVVSGNGAYLARHCDTRVFGPRADWLRKQVAASLSRANDGDEPVEILATFGLNVQVHPLLTPRCIVYPGESVVLSHPQRAIPWSCLHVGFDEGADRVSLFEQPGGKRLLPLRTGPVSPHLLPVLYRVLASFGPGCVPDFSLLNMLECRSGAPETVRRYPRVTFGDVVLLRRTWRIPAQAGPPRGRTDTDFAAFLELRRWARELDLPSRVFVVPVEISDYFRERRPAGSLRRLYKPFYVDFDSPLSCLLLHRFTADLQSTLTISEMLPAPEQLPLSLEGRPYVSELLLEMS